MCERSREAADPKVYWTGNLGRELSIRGPDSAFSDAQPTEALDEVPLSVPRIRGSSGLLLKPSSHSRSRVIWKHRPRVTRGSGWTICASSASSSFVRRC